MSVVNYYHCGKHSMTHPIPTIFRHSAETLRSNREHGFSLLEVMIDDSPLPTKRLRERAGLDGREHEATFTRAMRPLWRRMLVVGVGEEAEGGFPSLAVGATRLLREPLWQAAEELTADDRALLARTSVELPSFARAFRKVLREIESTVVPAP